MAMYARVENLLDMIPGNPPQKWSDRTVELHPELKDDTNSINAAWLEKIGSIIAEKSEYIDTSVGSQYGYAYGSQKFPNADDEPATPIVIQTICKNLCLFDIYGMHKGLFQGRTDDTSAHFRNLAEDALEKIRKGEIVIAVNGKNLITLGDVSIETRNEAIAAMEQF